MVCSLETVFVLITPVASLVLVFLETIVLVFLDTILVLVTLETNPVRMSILETGCVSMLTFKEMMKLS